MMTVEEAKRQLEKAAIVTEGYIGIVASEVDYLPFFCKAANIHDAPRTEMAGFVNDNRLFSSEAECRNAIESRIKRFNSNLEEINEIRRVNGKSPAAPLSIDTYLVKIVKIRYTQAAEVIE